MMGTGLAEQVDRAMMRSQRLAAQRRAAGVVLQRYAAVPPVARWARAVMRADEPRGYRLLFRIAERGVSC